MFQMEKQKVLYEEKALVALQKATQDKTEAVSKAATLQVKRISTCRNMKSGPVSVCYHGLLHINQLRLHV